MNVGVRNYAANMSLDSSLRAWSDSQLANAVMTSTNWRAVMRALGLNATSASQIRAVRRHAERLKLDDSHFRGKRRWSDAQLRQAVIESRSWQEVISRLGLTTGYGATTHIKSHTVRLGIETSHLSRLSHTGRLPSEPRAQASDLKAQLKYLRVGAGTLAATWFTLRGCAVSFPTEPTIYDLLADTSQGIMRVQVKTTTSVTKNGWQVGVGHRPDTHSKKQGRVLAYSPDEIDLFFIVDGDMTMYLIPSRAIAGRVGILLRTYRKYIVGNARGLLGDVETRSTSVRLGVIG
jgi:PD-(D/E)XK endonuclease